MLTSRALLFASAAIVAVPAASPALAQAARPVSSVETAHQTPAMLAPARQQVFVGDPVRPVGSDEQPQIAINDQFTPVQAQDPVNVNGVGQMIVDSGGGFIGTCTGTLINRRTVLFAAHCVNTRAATDYGANTGGTPIAFGFETNTRANAAGQTDELLRWLRGGVGGAGQYQTNTAQSFYNASQVFWNPASVSATSCTGPGSCFLESDVALAVLDTPANNVPTWAMLFSPLATPDAIDPANGTGYHVTVTGYGSTGTGTTGASASGGFRRRIAENLVGGLTSLATRNEFLFGTPGAPVRGQVLYFLDFDDPTRTNPNDFNSFRDNALPREGTTGPGDSGGPLILDQAYARPLVIGVLSGGSTFFAGQPGGSYGSQSLYQPLFLTWDWIAANNPYRYVSALSGTRAWEDAAGWRTDLDPNYFVITGNAVNGVPTAPGAGAAGQTPQFGEFCFQSDGFNECQDIATGQPRNNVPNTRANGAAGMAPADGSTPALLNIGEAIDAPAAVSGPGYSAAPLPAPTLANGLPGATGFVPNNSAGNRATGVSARYYDVSLREAGTVTLNSNVTIDNMTVRGAQAQLNVASGASLTSLFEFNQLTGTVRNDGTITSAGDYLLLSGLLTGTGRINAPFVTSVIGTIAPGTMSTIGTLTIGGNLVMASGSGLAINIGADGTSDRVAVVAGAAAGSGTANIGGTVTFLPVDGATIRFGDTYTILTATGGVSGRFNTPSALSVILRPEFVYNATSVQARIAAGLYANVVAAGSPVQTAYAGLLDRNRTNYSALSGVYGFLDLQNAATIQSTLEALAPRQEALVQSSSVAAVESMNRFYRGRLAALDPAGSFDGQVAMTGRPLQFAALVAQGAPMGAMPGAPVTASDTGDATVAPARLPQGTRGFVAGGYLDGNGRSMPTASPRGDEDDFDGWYVAAGIEAQVDVDAVLGFGLSYTKLDGTTDVAPQRVRGELIQGTLYGKSTFGPGVLDAQFSAGWLGTRTSRGAALGTTAYTLRSDRDSLVISTEVGLSAQFGEAIKIGPRIAGRASSIGFEKTIETGGPLALAYDRRYRNSGQGLAGLTIGAGTSRLRPTASAYYVHEFLDVPTVQGANFVAGVGPNSLFALNGRDRDWAEVSVGIQLDTNRVSLSISADTTVWRRDVSNQAYRGSIAFHF